MVSWTRSSASAGLAVSRSATRYRLSRWISASRSKPARFSASAARAEAGGGAAPGAGGGGGGGGRGGAGGGVGWRNPPPRARGPQRGGGALPDAALVFADAGRRAARRGVRRLCGLTRLAARAAPRVFGYGAARRAARAVFGAELRRERQVPTARVSDVLAVHATPDGSACALYGTGFTELLRLLVGFEGAMLHVSCRATGGAVCEWRAAPPDPRHH